MNFIAIERFRNQFTLFFVGEKGTHRVVLRFYSWCSSQRSLPVVLKGLYTVPEIKQGLTKADTCKVSTFPCVLSHQL